MPSRLALIGVLLLLAAGPIGAEQGLSAGERLEVSPPAATLDGPEASLQLLVRRADKSGRLLDVTRKASFRLTPPGIVSIDSSGLLTPLAEGKAMLHVAHEAATANVNVEVRGLRDPKRVPFDTQVLSALTKTRCNSGGCHGKAEGQHGFKLSVFGNDPAADHEAITRESRQRRVVPGAPERSLLIQKATNALPHGGGRRIEPGSIEYRVLCRWIQEGALREENAVPIVAIAVEPPIQTLHHGETQQIQVMATDAEGRRFCATRAAEFESNAESIAHVDQHGLTTAGDSPGEAAIVVRYMQQVAVCRITLPQGDIQFSRPQEANVIDRLVWDRLDRLGVQPSGLCDDATFLRRACLDVIGRLPTPTEARSFLSENRQQPRDKPQRRGELIDSLLNRPEYADYWTMRWADLLRVDHEKLTAPGALAVTRWLRKEFTANRPYDEFARAIVTARGDTTAEGPAAIYRVFATPEELGRSVSQLFLGVRIECAQCHHHPFERWSQDDYYGLAGFFTGTTLKPLPTGSPAIVPTAAADLKNPRTSRLVPARALGAPPPAIDALADRRQAFADWMTSPENPYFARAIVNRIWAQYMGRGLVEPIDDFRATNPATNEPLLNELARQLVASRYDLKAVQRLILNSRVYQLSAETNKSNARDDQNFSHARPKALPAEVLADAISDAAGLQQKFEGWAPGVRAVDLWDNNVESYFLRIFGRPARATVCSCERSAEPSIAQALHLLNSEELASKIESPEGRANQLARSNMAPPAVIEELYLATLSRFPTERERARALDEFQHSDRRRAAEDILWALVNSKQFLYAW